MANEPKDGVNSAPQNDPDAVVTPEEAKDNQ